MKKIIDRLTFRIFRYIFKKQELMHEKRMEKLNKRILSGSICGEKIHTSIGATLCIQNGKDEEKKANQEKIQKIIEKYLDNPSEIFNYIKGAKTSVYKIKCADKILGLIQENEGFIYPKKGIKALYLNLILNKKISFKTPEMFVLRNFNVNKYEMSYQFYNWYCYKMKLDGYEIETQEKFKHVFKICESAKINSLSYEEILALKSAIKRDVEAIDFVKKLASDKSMAKKNLEKIKLGKKVQV